MAGLNLEKLNNRIVSTVSTTDALKEVSPIFVPDKVIDGKSKMIVSEMNLDKKQRSVGIKISYV